MRPIVSFDVDMTLLDHKTWRIPDSAMRALEQLRENYRIVIATGRDMDSDTSAAVRDQIRPEAIIHMNGTKVTAGGKTIFEHLFDKDLLGRMLAYVEKGVYSIGASVEGKDYYINPERVLQHDIEIWGNSFRRFYDPWELMDLPVRTLAYIGDESGAKDIEAHFPEVNLHMFSERRGADVVEKTASKAEGLRRLCEYYGIDLDQTVAFGDSMNDYEIIKLAGTGIAMGNAMEELKAAADYVTDPVDQDGIWNACLHFHLIDGGETRAVRL